MLPSNQHIGFPISSYSEGPGTALNVCQNVIACDNERYSTLRDDLNLTSTPGQHREEELPKYPAPPPYPGVKYHNPAKRNISPSDKMPGSDSTRKRRSVMIFSSEGVKFEEDTATRMTSASIDIPRATKDEIMLKISPKALRKIDESLKQAGLDPDPLYPSSEGSAVQHRYLGSPGPPLEFLYFKPPEGDSLLGVGAYAFQRNNACATQERSRALPRAQSLCLSIEEIDKEVEGSIAFQNESSVPNEMPDFIEEEKITFTPESLKKVEEILKIEGIPLDMPNLPLTVGASSVESSCATNLNLNFTETTRNSPKFVPLHGPCSGLNLLPGSMQENHSREKGISESAAGSSVRTSVPLSLPLRSVRKVRPQLAYHNEFPGLVLYKNSSESCPLNDLTEECMEKFSNLSYRTGESDPMIFRGPEASFCPLNVNSTFGNKKATQDAENPGPSRQCHPKRSTSSSEADLNRGEYVTNDDKSLDPNIPALDDCLASTYCDDMVNLEMKAGEMAAERRGNGRRRIDDNRLSAEEKERLRIKREKNREAAARCRQKKTDKIEKLESEVDILEEEQRSVREELDALRRQKEELELVLEAHKATCRKPNRVILYPITPERYGSEEN